MTSDPLEYFHQEYQSLQEYINKISSLTLECKDALYSSMDIQKRVLEMYKDNTLKLQDIKAILDALSKIVDTSSSLLDNVQHIKTTISFHHKGNE